MTRNIFHWEIFLQTKFRLLVTKILSLKVNFLVVSTSSLTFKSEPHCGQYDIWLGGVLTKEVTFICVFFTNLIKPIL